MKKADREQIKEWLEGGGNLEKGLRLFLKLRSNAPAYRIVRTNPQANKTIAVRLLLKAYGIDSNSVIILKTKPKEPLKIETQSQTTETPKFRDMFPFLNEPNTPAELKILAADKITSYKKYVDAHKQLNACVSIEQCYLTAKEIIENYLENQLITTEFKHYMETKKVLGKHKIFDIYKKIQLIRAKRANEIIKEQKRTINRINRIKYEINKGNKPHLQTERERSLRENEVILAEINRIIDGI